MKKWLMLGLLTTIIIIISGCVSQKTEKEDQCSNANFDVKDFNYDCAKKAIVLIVQNTGKADITISKISLGVEERNYSEKIAVGSTSYLEYPYITKAIGDIKEGKTIGIDTTCPYLKKTVSFGMGCLATHDTLQIDNIKIDEKNLVISYLRNIGANAIRCNDIQIYYDYSLIGTASELSRCDILGVGEIYEIPLNRGCIEGAEVEVRLKDTFEQNKIKTNC